MLPGYANKWWETLILAVGVCAIYHLITSLVELAA
jgi:hypothetical protein